MVYYRKYRPQIIADLDSSKLRETIYAILSNSSLPHAFLFTGPKGLGKTSTARILAKAINCEHINQSKEKDKQIEPDNICYQCLSITSGVNIDVLEIDGASNRGIDEIRELRERVNLASSSAKKKVYIIDEVHMLTTEAFNALLKTIEEPPDHVVFIFCTTEPQKVPETIISRCFHIAFTLATEEEIVHSLKRIVKGEKLTIDDESLNVISHISEGGFRDAAKILEELVLLSKDKKINSNLIEEKYKINNIENNASSLIKLLSQTRENEDKSNNLRVSLELISGLTKSGTDIKYFITRLLEILEEQLLISSGVIIKRPKGKFEAQILKLEQIQNLIMLIAQAYTDTKFAVIPQLPLEMAIIQYFNFLREENYSSVNIQENDIITTNSNKNTIDSLLKKQKQIQVKTLLSKKASEKQTKSESSEKVIHQSSIQGKPDGLTALYENIIYKVKPYNHSVAGVLRGSRIKEINDTLIIFEAAYKFHKERLEEKKTCEIIEKAVKELTGKSLKISVVLKK